MRELQKPPATPVEAKQERWVCLLKFLQDDETFDDYLMTVQERIIKRNIQRRTKRKLYKGELEQVHGKSEAADFIKRKNTPRPSTRMARMRISGS